MARTLLRGIDGVVKQMFEQELHSHLTKTLGALNDDILNEVNPVSLSFLKFITTQNRVKKKRLNN